MREKQKPRLTHIVSADQLELTQPTNLQLLIAHILPLIYQYKGMLMVAKDSGNVRNADLLITYVRTLAENPYTATVVAKSPEDNDQPYRAYDSLHLSMPYRQKDFYELAFTFPTSTRDEGGKHARSLEVLPAKLRTTRRGGVGVDALPLGVSLIERGMHVESRGVLYDVNRMPHRSFTALDSPVERRAFDQLFTTMRRDHRMLFAKGNFQM